MRCIDCGAETSKSGFCNMCGSYNDGNIRIKFVCPICGGESLARKKRKDQSIRMYCKCGNHMKEVRA